MPMDNNLQQEDEAFFEDYMNLVVKEGNLGAPLRKTGERVHQYFNEEPFEKIVPDVANFVAVPVAQGMGATVGWTVGGGLRRPLTSAALAKGTGYAGGRAAGNIVGAGGAVVGHLIDEAGGREIPSKIIQKVKEAYKYTTDPQHRYYKENISTPFREGEEEHLPPPLPQGESLIDVAEKGRKRGDEFAGSWWQLFGIPAWGKNPHALQSEIDLATQWLGEKFGIIPNLYKKPLPPEVGEIAEKVPQQAAEIAGRENPSKIDAINALQKRGITVSRATIDEPSTTKWGERVVGTPWAGKPLIKSVTKQGEELRDLVSMENPKNIWQEAPPLSSKKTKPDIRPGSKDMLNLSNVQDEGEAAIGGLQSDINRILVQHEDEMARAAGLPPTQVPPLSRQWIRHPDTKRPFPSPTPPTSSPMQPESFTPLPDFQVALTKELKSTYPGQDPTTIAAALGERLTSAPYKQMLQDISTGQPINLPIRLVHDLRRTLHEVGNELGGHYRSAVNGLVGALDSDVDNVVSQINPTYSGLYDNYKSFYDTHYAPFFSENMRRGMEYRGRVKRMFEPEEPTEKWMIKDVHDVEALDELEKQWGNYEYVQPNTGNKANIGNFVANTKVANVAKWLDDATGQGGVKTGQTSFEKVFHMWNTMSPKMKKKIFNFGDPQSTEKYIQDVDNVMSGVAMYVRSGLENPHSFMSTVLVSMGASAGIGAGLDIYRKGGTIDWGTAGSGVWAAALTAGAMFGGMRVLANVLSKPSLVNIAANGMQGKLRGKAAQQLFGKFMDESGMKDVFYREVKKGAKKAGDWEPEWWRENEGKKEYNDEELNWVKKQLGQ